MAHRTQRHGDECKQSMCLPFCHSTQVHSTLAPYCNRIWLLAERIKFLCVPLTSTFSFFSLPVFWFTKAEQPISDLSQELKCRQPHDLTVNSWQPSEGFRHAWSVMGLVLLVASLLEATSPVHRPTNEINNQSKISNCYSMSVFTKGKKTLLARSFLSFTLL